MENIKDPSFKQMVAFTNIFNEAVNNTTEEKKVTSDEFQKVISKPNKVFELVDQLFVDVLANKEIILNQIYTTKIFTLETIVGGQVSIAKVKDTFDHVDLCFKDWSINDERDTEAVEVNIFKLIKDATNMEMFSFLNKNLDNLCLTPAQIICFCKKYKTHLIQDGPTFFLLKEGKYNSYFVGSVRKHNDSISIKIDSLKNDGIYFSHKPRNLVVPA
jgi:hypothetical protein